MEKCMNCIWKKCAKRYANTVAGFDSENELEFIQGENSKTGKRPFIGVCEVEDVEELLDQE